jgi:hypothetical protein
MKRNTAPKCLERNLILFILIFGSLAAAQNNPGSGTQHALQSGSTLFGPTAAAVPAGEEKRATSNVEALESAIEQLTLRVARLEAMIENLLAGASHGRQEGSWKLPVDSPQAHPPAEHESKAAASVSGPAESSLGAAPQSGRPAADAAASPVAGLRFSGDFRLRLDGIVRPAYSPTAPDQASLPHVQNIRGRYRFRLNLDAGIHPNVAFHGQLATGPMNNPLTLDQDFSSTVAHHPFMINEAWVDVQPWNGVTFQGGRVREVYADSLRFLFDDDVAFNGFNQRYSRELARPLAGFRRVELRGGQYFFSNPNVAVVTAGNLGGTGALIGSTGRAAQMFHQGFVLERRISGGVSDQIGADIQIYRNPNQIQFASTVQGIPVIVQDALGIALSGPMKGSGNATTTSGGSIYTARGFQVARLTYRLDIAGFKSDRQEYPVSIHVQLARNVATSQPQRDALLAALKLGSVREPWSHSFTYLFAIKGANSLISQLTDDDLGTHSGVNIRTHCFRFDIGIVSGIQLQSLLFVQNELNSSGQYPRFFVPMNSYTPRQYRFQQQLAFVF